MHAVSENSAAARSVPTVIDLERSSSSRAAAWEKAASLVSHHPKSAARAAVPWEKAASPAIHRAKPAALPATATPKAVFPKVGLEFTIAVGENGSPLMFRLGVEESERIEVGRHPDSHIVLTLKGASNHHLDFRVKQAHEGAPFATLVMVDKSSNGTGIETHDGRKIRVMKGRPSVMDDGSRIHLPYVYIESDDDPGANCTFLTIGNIRRIPMEELLVQPANQPASESAESFSQPPCHRASESKPHMAEDGNATATGAVPEPSTVEPSTEHTSVRTFTVSSAPSEPSSPDGSKRPVPHARVKEEVEPRVEQEASSDGCAEQRGVGKITKVPMKEERTTPSTHATVASPGIGELTSQLLEALPPAALPERSRSMPKAEVENQTLLTEGRRTKSERTDDDDNCIPSVPLTKSEFEDDVGVSAFAAFERGVQSPEYHPPDDAFSPGNDSVVDLDVDEPADLLRKRTAQANEVASSGEDEKSSEDDEEAERGAKRLVRRMHQRMAKRQKKRSTLRGKKPGRGRAGSESSSTPTTPVWEPTPSD